MKHDIDKFMTDDDYHSELLGLTIPCILSTVFQLNICIILPSNVVKIAPDILGKIELDKLETIFLIQKPNRLYDVAIDKNIKITSEQS